VGIFEEVTARPKKLSASELEALRGQPARDVLRELRIRPWQLPSLTRRIKRLAGSRIPDTTTAAGMDEALADLSLRYRMIVLSTNSPGTIRSFLENNGLEELFSVIYGDVPFGGKTRALRRILKCERGLGASGCVYIGDEIRDIEAAKRAGLPSVGVAWGFTDAGALRNAAPTAFASAPRELITIAQALT
jgi:phosphoglycolate phosphatase